MALQLRTINEILTKLSDFTKSVRLLAVDNSGTPIDVYIELQEFLAILAVAGMTDSFQFGGQAHGGSYALAYSASITFNGNNGNIQTTTFTGDAVISFSNLLPGTFQYKGKISGAGVSSITLDSSAGSPYDDNHDIPLTDGSFFTITVQVDNDLVKTYTITSKSV